MSFLLESLHRYIPNNEQAVQEIAARFSRTSLPRKHQWVRAGGMSRQLALIEAGYLRMYGSIDGKETTIWIGGPGKFVTAISSFIDQSPSIWNIEALNDCHIHVISRESHFELCEHFKEWLAFENLLLSKAISALEYRNYELQGLKAEDRYQALFSKHPTLFLHVPAKYIASLLGISQETLSRLRKEHRNFS